MVYGMGYPVPPAPRLLRGWRGHAAGDIVRGLLRTGVHNPVVILEAVDDVEEEKAAGPAR